MPKIHLLVENQDDGIAANGLLSSLTSSQMADYVDVVGVLVFAAVMLLLPAVEDSASFIAGVAGGAVGLAAGIAAATSGRTTGL